MEPGIEDEKKLGCDPKKNEHVFGGDKFHFQLYSQRTFGMMIPDDLSIFRFEEGAKKGRAAPKFLAYVMLHPIPDKSPCYHNVS